MRLRAIRKAFVIELTHNEVCASTGRCTCTPHEFKRRTTDEMGKPGHKYVYNLVPKSVTLLAGKPQDVPDAVLRFPRVQRAIKRGRLVGA